MTCSGEKHVPTEAYILKCLVGQRRYVEALVFLNSSELRQASQDQHRILIECIDTLSGNRTALFADPVGLQIELNAWLASGGSNALVENRILQRILKPKFSFNKKPRG